MTFRAGRARPRAGVLVDGGTHVLDLQAAHRARYRRSSSGLASVLVIVEGGDEALELEVERIGILRNRVVKPANRAD